MIIKSFTRNEAEKAYEELHQNSFNYQDNQADTYLRKKLFEALCKIVTDVGDDERKKYTLDLDVGLKLYSILPPKDITLRTASDDGVWRYLSVRVLPDLVHKRWGDNPIHFWSMSRRIWLKTLWWYVHISWQGDEPSTRAVLEKFSTDEIVQLVERSGSGYRIELYREIMKQYGVIVRGNDGCQDIFRIVMKLNTATLISMEPAFSEGGIEGYVKRLFDSIPPSVKSKRMKSSESNNANYKSSFASSQSGSIEPNPDDNSGADPASKPAVMEEDDAKALFSQGENYFYARGIGQDYHKAFVFFLNSAKKGYIPAIRQAAVMLENGMGIQRNTVAADKMYRLASQKGDMNV